MQRPNHDSSSPTDASRADAAGHAGGGLFVAAWVVLAVLHVWPLLTVVHLPMQDIPIHLGILRTMADQGVAPHWSERFTVELAFAPYVTYYALGSWLTALVGVIAANRLLLVAAALATPLAFAFLARELSRTREPKADASWAGLLGFLFFFNDPYLIGFTNFLLAWPLVLLGTGLALRFVQRRERSWPTLALFVAVAFLATLTHPLAALLLFLLSLVCALVWSESLARLLWLAPATLPSLALVFPFISGGLSSVATRHWLPLADTLRYLAWCPFTLLEGGDRTALAATLVLLGAALLAALVRARATLGRALVPRRRRAALAVLILVAAYFAVPFETSHLLFIDARIALIAWTLLLAALAPALTASVLQRALVVLAIAASAVGTTRVHTAFEREIAPLFDVIDVMEPDARLLPIVYDRESAALWPIYADRLPFYTPYAHFGCWYHVEKGGISPFMTFHASLPWIPLRLRDPFYAERFGVASPFVPDSILGNLPELIDHFDYVLLRGDDRRARRRIAEFAQPIAKLREFELFEVPRAAPR